MFWEKYVELCASVGKTPNAVAREIEISSGTVSFWKKGKQPQALTLAKVANYFGVPVEYFNGETTAGTEKAPASGTDTEARYMMELFNQLDGEDRKKAVAYLLALSQEATEDKQ